MSAVTNMWRQMVQRRLWPVAILLIAALAAVPLTLANEPAAAPAPPADAALGDDELAVVPIVAVAGASDRAERRRVLGAVKNPFAVVKPSTAPTAVSADSAPAAPQANPGSPSGGAPPSSGGGTPPSFGSPVTETPETPETPETRTRTYDRFDLTVRFGEAGAGTARQTLKRLAPLPSAEEPALIYLGVLEDGKTAVFLLDHEVETVGDGECEPTPDECETLRLRAGETEFFDVKDETGAVTAQYQLDLVKIHRGGTVTAASAGAGYEPVERAVAQLP